MTNLKELTKEKLIQLYSNESLSQDKIAKHYGVSRKQIASLIKQYQIPIFTKTEIGNRKLKNKLPSKENLEKLLETMSNVQIAAFLKIGRVTVANLMKKYGLNSTYFKNDLGKDKLVLMLQTQTPLEIADLNGWKIETVNQRINYYGIVLESTLLSEDETRSQCTQIDIEKWDNQGFIKRVIYGDPSLYNSVLHHTNDHNLSTNKFTERVYRILNRFKSEEVVGCQGCHDPLKFYTMKLGYGFNSEKDRLYCRNCYVHSQYFSGCSKASQNLFQAVYDILPAKLQETVQFRTLNREKSIPVRMQHGGNRNYYLLDFFVNNKNIEFDGIWWHKNRTEKDRIRDEYLRTQGIEILRITDQEWYKNSSFAISRCLDFLTGESHVATQSQ